MYYLRLLPLLILLALLSACGPDLRPGVAEAYAALPDRVDFNFHVKPILSDRCYACHGPDAQNQQADLRLDNAEGAYAALTSGNGFAIVPGKLAQSEMIARINSDDPQLVMPTPESNLELSNREIAILTKWVEQGAEYKAHWAFEQPVKPTVPATGEGWAANEVDRFVMAKLDLEKVAPSPEAERHYLIRRAYFDLTGLPPKIADIDRWEGDESAEWYERLVDELLASPAYGERMAAYWMDVARFADSEGYLDDFHHELWPYRDWVIGAYNKNLPYDKFIEWQVGGDQQPDATTEQILATTFNRTHKQNSEGGIIPEEFRVEYVADRANTVGTAFMGLTMGCARCHDHKYDPISQQDYFELFAFFNNTVERGDAVFGLNGVNNDNAVPHALAMNAGPTLLLADSATQAIYTYIQHLEEEQQAELTALENKTSAPASAPTQATLQRTVRNHTLHHFSFDQHPVRDLAGGEMQWNSLQVGEGKIGQGIVVTDGSLASDGTASLFEHSDDFTVSFWIKAPKMYPEAHVLYNSNWRTQGYRGWDVVLDSNRVHLRLSHAHPFQSIDLRIDEPLVENEWTHVTWTYDGSGAAAGARVYVGGARIEPTVLRDHLVRSTVPYYGATNKATVYGHYSGLTIGQRPYDQNFAGGAVDELRVMDVAAGDLLARYLYEQPLGQFTPPTKSEAREYAFLHQRPDLAAQREALRATRARAIATMDTVREIMVMGDNELTQRQAFILERGVYDAQGKPVAASIPEALMGWPDGLPRNRYGLGKWLTHSDNPLTARVAVNQMWYLVFGRGLVESVEDFGNQGALPSHPDLLDWLAVDFRENGWNVKRLMRQMVTSSTYRQSSKIRPELNERDPDNRWLARAPRYRRSAEMIRDNALAVADLLQPGVGGPSAFSYQPDGLWAEVNHHYFSPTYKTDTANLYRRSLYTFWKRNAPPPAMLTFDASLRGECQVRRQLSNTPLQALVLLNDPQTLEACRVLAVNVLNGNNKNRNANDPATAEGSSETHDDGPADLPAGQSVGLTSRSAMRAPAPVSQIFRRLTGRPPTPREADILNQFYEDELTYFHEHPLAAQAFLSTGYHDTDQSAGAARVAALARVANTVLNSTEGFHKN